MAAVDLTFPTITHLPYILEGTCSATPDNVRRVNITPSRKLVYSVLAPSVALKVAVLSDSNVKADEAAAGAISKADVAVSASAVIPIGPNRKTGLPTPSQFYIFSTTANAPYTILVSEEE